MFPHAVLQSSCHSIAVEAQDFFLVEAKFSHSLPRFLSLALSPCQLFHVNTVSSIMSHVEELTLFSVFFFVSECKARSRGRAVILCVPFWELSAALTDDTAPKSIFE